MGILDSIRSLTTYVRQADQLKPPFTIGGRYVKLVATQPQRGAHPIMYVYNIEKTRIILYNQSQETPMFMDMAPDDGGMEFYAEKFLPPTDPEWLALNHYTLMKN